MKSRIWERLNTHFAMLGGEEDISVGDFGKNSETTQETRNR
jgi:hypothetical protein